MSSMIKCKKHGKSQVMHVCKHIYNDLEKRIISPFRISPIMGMKICEDCYQKSNMAFLEGMSLNQILDLPDRKIDEIELIYEKNYKSIPSSVFCIKCWHELKALKGR